MNYGVMVKNDEINIVSDVIPICEQQVGIIEPRYIQILKTIKCGLGLDISMTSTGVTLWENETLKHYIIDVSIHKDSEETMRTEFKIALDSLIQNKDFDIVVIEDVYGGINFTTVRGLLCLNTVAEELQQESNIRVEHMIKYPNTEWKAIFRLLGEYEKNLNDKVQIQQILTSLGFDISSCSRYNMYGKKDRDQDIFDSLGLLLSGIAQQYLGIREKKPVFKLTDMKMWICEDLIDYQLCYSDGEEYDTFQITGTSKKAIEKSIISAIESVNANKTLVCEVLTDHLGLFAIEKKIPLDVESVCIVLTPKTAKKPRKHKPKKTIIIH